MAVVHHALRWQMSEAACAVAAGAAERARACDADGLSRLGEGYHRRAALSPEVLAAFDLADRDHVRSWLAPGAVHPALVTLLGWLPELTLLGEGDAVVLAAHYRRGGSPVAPLAEAGRSFLPLSRALDALFGRSSFASRPTPGSLGMWARAAPLERRLRRCGDRMAAGRVAAMTGPDPDRAWLVTTTIW